MCGIAKGYEERRWHWQGATGHVQYRLSIYCIDTHTHTHTNYTQTHPHKHMRSTCAHTPPHTQVSTSLLFLLLHNGRCRVCLCKTIHAECHLSKDSCYKCMVQWELQTANGAVKVAIVACNTLVFGNSMHMLGPLGQWNPSQHRHFMACECQTIDHDGMARDHLQVSEKRGTPLSTLPWRLITNWFTDCAWHCICMYVYTITVAKCLYHVQCQILKCSKQL